jgi:hypothetical protein
MFAEANIPLAGWVHRPRCHAAGAAPGDYWIGVTVPAIANGSAGATPEVSCHTVIELLVANARWPVVPGVAGSADA